ncbi:MAG: ABC transporter ATP-binding protein [Gammaproteobacteria bacterium]|nr:ABC transporter ATP-binding protein [Gammaproteobacteria bacterium]
MSSKRTCAEKRNPSADLSFLALCNVTKEYRTAGNLWGGGSSRITAVADVTLRIRAGEAWGLVGESGSGKSTLARMAVALQRPTSGKVVMSGADLGALGKKALRGLRRQMQIVFQNPYSALDPLMSVGASIEEPLVNFDVADVEERKQRVANLLRDVGLPERVMNAYPHQLSGGERQRACIARAIALRPQFLVCDEPVSALDKSVQAQIINLLCSLKEQYGLTYLLISHDLAVVNHVCDKVAVMLRGKIIEQGDRRDVLFQPAHPYTQALKVAASDRIASARTPVQPRGLDAPPERGCIFQDRCPSVQRFCQEETPVLREIRTGHLVACHFPNISRTKP